MMDSQRLEVHHEAAIRRHDVDAVVDGDRGQRLWRQRHHDALVPPRPKVGAEFVCTLLGDEHGLSRRYTTTAREAVAEGDLGSFCRRGANQVRFHLCTRRAVSQPIRHGNKTSESHTQLERGRGGGGG